MTYRAMPVFRLLFARVAITWPRLPALVPRARQLDDARNLIDRGNELRS